ncbi:hypothetical protein [Bacillus thuringiensis]|uniref:Uncharacterized protein n=1 Tax=Bacillus thuringiensis DB27 TaxID=1431339 RepID=W8Z715_BACTU|nr:hypothetical protein [Bacillus thuringiensis]MBG9633143.1 hypothetical protein [Bacillus thuringiensis]MBG9665092.1 hypothetical protein [Bacillus thuringiensis]MBH0352509.1 hypothetical protein [Bacillus thuringiensis]CDN38395.1 unnamed protein product [Bacillus thuringiensis DB27]
MSPYSKITVSSGKTYMTPFDLQHLIEKMTGGNNGKICDEFIQIVTIDTETGEEKQVVLNPQQIVVMEEAKFKRTPHVPAVFKYENQ